MKLREEIIIAPMNNESILVDASGKFKGMIKLNESAAFIATCFMNDITLEEAKNMLMNEYEINDLDAMNAINSFVSRIKEVGLFE